MAGNWQPLAAESAISQPTCSATQASEFDFASAAGFVV
jgi:hypothetical protein